MQTWSLKEVTQALFCPTSKTRDIARDQYPLFSLSPYQTLAPGPAASSHENKLKYRILRFWAERLALPVIVS
jgi:hypothetical protein